MVEVEDGRQRISSEVLPRVVVHPLENPISTRKSDEILFSRFPTDRHHIPSNMYTWSYIKNYVTLRWFKGTRMDQLRAQILCGMYGVEKASDISN